MKNIIGMNKLLVILGSTATGKTDLALSLAKKFNGEIISCDSRQVYRGLDIGTGKLPNQLKIKNLKLKILKADGYWKINGVKIWMYDVVSPSIQYSVADYVKDANKVIKDVIKRGKLPIIVGGTGLYLKALLEGLPNLTVPVDPKLRKKLEKLSKEQLQLKLKEIAPSKWSNVNESDRHNPRRLVRAIELSLSSLRGVKRRSNPDMRLLRPFGARNDVLKIGLTAPKEILYKKVDDRVISRIAQGMIEETLKLHKKGLTLKRMKQLGLEYGILADYLEGKIRRDELIKILQSKIHGYVRRQLTWFKREKDVIWMDVINKDFSAYVEKVVSKWYYRTDESS